MAEFSMYPTIITPYTAENKVDYESLQRLIASFAAIGCDGVFAVCQSSEMFFLSDEEKLELARRSIALCRENGMRCVVSGHTQEGFDAQIAYLKKLEKLKPDAIILVSNRLAEPDESEVVASTNLKKLLAALEPETRLGIYECPYPYKRLLTSELIDVMLADGRFRFIKDTCCRIAVIKDRLKQLKNSEIKLYNANMATLRESILFGAAGYSGIMLNMQPEIFSLLKKALDSGKDSLAGDILTYLSATSTIEYQNYPRSAKYLQTDMGTVATLVTRTPGKDLTESQRKELDCFRQDTLYRAKLFEKELI